jgi:hypothetical protein
MVVQSSLCNIEKVLGSEFSLDLLFEFFKWMTSRLPKSLKNIVCSLYSSHVMDAEPKDIYIKHIADILHISYLTVINGENVKRYGRN